MSSSSSSDRLMTYVANGGSSAGSAANATSLMNNSSAYSGPSSLGGALQQHRPHSAVTAAQKRIYEYSARKFQRYEVAPGTTTHSNSAGNEAPQSYQSKGMTEIALTSTGASVLESHEYTRPHTEPGKPRLYEAQSGTPLETASLKRSSSAFDARSTSSGVDNLETSSADSSVDHRSSRSNSLLEHHNDMLDRQSSHSGHSSHHTNTAQSTTKDPQQPNVIAPRDDEVIIHVYDETNKVNKDFCCKRDLLLREMKYFTAYLTDNCSFDDIDISVHCDVNIFQWLMDYIKNPGKPPKLDTSWAVSILISSDFLEMGKLVQTTLKFVHDRLQQIIKLPIELDCINNKLMTKLAKLFTCEELDQIRDKRDKIISRLYMKKVEQYLSEQGYALAFCQQCKKVYHTDFRSWMVCPKAKMFVDVHGKMVAKHSIDPTWSINKYIISMRKSLLTWKQIYWRIWGVFQCFYCTRCESLFPSNEMDWCSYHPKEAVFEADTNVGRYVCCKSKAMCFDSAAVTPPRGCTPRNHVVTTNKDSSDSKALDLLMRKTKQVCTPYGSSLPTGENEETFDLLANEEATTLEGLADPQDDMKDEKLQINYHKYEIYHTYSRKYQVDTSSLNAPLKLDRKKKKKLETYAKMSATRKRFFLLDKQRDRDMGLMRNITNMLHKCRKHAKNQPDKKKKKKGKSSRKTGTQFSTYKKTNNRML